MTAITAQGTRCGNRKAHGSERAYHADAAAVRECYWGNEQAVVSTPPTPAPSQAPRNADEARTAASRRLAEQNSPFVRGSSYPASEKQLLFITDLANEVLTEVARDALLGRMNELTGAEAKALITDMMTMRTSQRAMKAAQPAEAKPQGAWKADLIKKVMGNTDEGNFAIVDGDGKTRFYRISKRGSRSRRPGTWKIQERVTDMLLPRADAMLTTVCTAIINMGGPEASGKMFFERLHMCYKCGASLTDDTGNPYYAMGLGPDCGAK